VIFIDILRQWRVRYLRKVLRNCITGSFTPAGKPTNLLAGYSKKMQKTRPDRWFGRLMD
jgi:hypothetical protein